MGGLEGGSHLLSRESERGTQPLRPNAAPSWVSKPRSQLLGSSTRRFAPSGSQAVTPATTPSSPRPRRSPVPNEREHAVLGPGGAAARAAASASPWSPPAPAGEAAPATPSAAGEAGPRPPPRRAMAAEDPWPAPGSRLLPPARPPGAGCVAAAAKCGLRAPGATAEVRKSPRGEPAPQLPAPGPALCPPRPAA